MKNAARLIASAAAVALFFGSGAAALRQSAPAARWVTAWSASQQALGTVALTNATVRMIARVTVPGEAVRIRIDNAFGTAPLVIGRHTSGNGFRREPCRRIEPADPLQQGRKRDSACRWQPDKRSGFDESSEAAGSGSEYLFLRRISGRANTQAPIDLLFDGNGSGDASGNEMAAPFTVTTTAMFWLKSIDVSSSTSTGSIVAFGDSITDGTCYDRRARPMGRCFSRPAVPRAAGRGKEGMHKAINEGIGGNTITREKLQPAGQSRA